MFNDCLILRRVALISCRSDRHQEVHFSRMRIALPRNIVLVQHDNDLPIHFKVNRGTPSLGVALDFSV